MQWLPDVGVISICHCLNFSEMPLKGNYDESRYKLYLADTGILIGMMDDETSADLRRKNNEVCPHRFVSFDFIAEHFTGTPNNESWQWCVVTVIT